MNANDSRLAARTLPYRQRLIETMKQEGTPLTPALQEAFLAIPRHVFLDHYYRQGANGLFRERVDAPPPEAAEAAWQAWYEVVYQDEALVTLTDERGIPLSSSSAPSAMAQMLEPLEVSAGQRVLEIGAGTGYHAALLAQVVGDPRLVTSIEVNPALAAQARERLNAVVEAGAQVHTGDGITWMGEPEAYERLIATGSHPTVPATWTRMLKADGILVMEVRGPLVGVLVQWRKGTDGTLTGRLVPGWRGAFMRLHAGNGYGARSPLYTDQPVIERASVAGEAFSLALLEEAGLALWLQCAHPHLEARRQYTLDFSSFTLYLIDTAQAASIVMREQADNTWDITVHGNTPLWTQVQATIQQWQAAGRPGLDRYALHVDAQGQMGLLLQ